MRRVGAFLLVLVTSAAAPAGSAVPRHLGPVTAIVVVGDEQLSCSQAGVLLAKGNRITPAPSRRTHPHRILGLAVSAEKEIVVCGGIPGESGIVAAFDPISGTAAPRRIADDLAYSVAISNQGTLFAALADGRVLEIPRSGNPEIRHRHTAAARSVALSPDGRFLASGGTDRLVIFSDLGKPDSDPIPALDHTGRVDCLAFSPGSGQVASGSRDGKVRIHSPRDGRLIRTYSGLRGEVSAIFWNETHLLAGTTEGRLYRLNRADNTSRALHRAESPITAIAMAGERILLGIRGAILAVDGS